MAEDKILDFGDSERELNRIIGLLKQTDNVIKQISSDALTMGRNLAGINLPSDLSALTSENARLTAQIQAQAQALAQLQNQYTNLSQRRQRNTQQTAEEAVNQRLLARNARESAMANSQLAGAYGRLSAQQSIAARNVQNLISRGRLASQTQREFNRELSNAQREFDELNRRVNSADRAVQRFNRNVGNYPKQAFKGLKDLIGAFGIAGGVTLFASLAKDIFETTKEIQSLDLALKQVVQTNELFAQSQAFLSRISEAYGVNINDLTKQFTQFYVSAKDKISGREIEQIFESITKAGATMGLSTEQQERAFMALNQMMSKGTIQAEELRGQLGEALPGALSIMAKSLGVSEKKLGDMMKNGELLAADVLPKFAKQLEITYGIEQVQRVETLSAAQGRLSNSWIEFVRTLNESETGGITQFFSTILSGVNFVLQGLVDINKSLKSIRTEFINDATASTTQYLNAVEKASEKEALAILTRKDATKNLAELNEKLAQLNHEYALLDEVKPLNFLPSRIKRLKEVEKEIEQINASLGTQKGRILGAQQVLDELAKKDAPKAQADLTKAQLKAIEDALKAKYDAAKKEIELQILNQEVILNAENESYDNQFKALEKFIDLKQQLVTLDYNEQVRLAKGNKDKIRAAEIDAEMATIKNMQDGYSKQKTIRKKQNDEYIAELKDVEDFLKKYHEDQDLIQEASDEIFLKGFKSREEAYDRQLERLKELKTATNDYLKSFGEEFASNSGFGETFNTFFKQIETIDKNGNKVMTTMFKQLWEGADTTAKKFAVAFNSIAQTAQETFNFLTESGAKNFDAEKERLQAQYDTALQYAGDNKAAQEKLQEDLEKKKKDIDYREAKAKQRQALFNVAIDTAQAVVSAVAESPLTFGLPWSAFALALGATQAALISSQGIPRYWMGGEHDGGLMMINDGSGSNWKETFVTPDGNAYRSDKRNAIIDAPAGTKIYTHDQWSDEINNMMMLDGLLKSNGIMYNSQNSAFNYEAMDGIMNKYLGNVTVEKTVIDKDGFSSYVEKQGSKTKINRGFASSKGFRFK